RAEGLYRAAIAQSRRPGQERNLTVDLVNLGDLLVRRQRAPEATTLAREALGLLGSAKGLDAQVRRDVLTLASTLALRRSLDTPDADLGAAVREMLERQPAQAAAQPENLLLAWRGFLLDRRRYGEAAQLTARYTAVLERRKSPPDLVAARQWEQAALLLL